MLQFKIRGLRFPRLSLQRRWHQKWLTMDKVYDAIGHTSLMLVFIIIQVTDVVMSVRLNC